MKISHLLMAIGLLCCLYFSARTAYYAARPTGKSDVITCPNGAELQNSVTWWNPSPGAVNPSATFEATLKGIQASGRLTLAVDASYSRMPLYVKLDPNPVAVVCQLNHANTILSVAACRYKVAESYPAYSSTDVIPYSGCADMTSSDGYFNLMMVINNQTCTSEGGSIICKPV